jgi:alpha-tubulin suppressor-like RCC1 family protein
MRRHIAGIVAILMLGLAAPAFGSAVSRTGSYLNGERFMQTTPLAVPGLSKVTAVDASNSSSYALRSDGTVWAWGNNEKGQLGNGTLTSSLTTPVQVSIPATIVSIGEAKNEGMAIDSTGHAWVWGENGSGSLCVPGRNFKITEPMQVPGIANVVAVQGGEEHTLWLTAAGTVLACGRNTYGELGLGEGVGFTRTATVVPGVSSIVQISAGSRTSAALDGKGQVFMWGNNAHGAIGIGSTEPIIWTATHVVLPGPASAISTGGDLGSNGSSLAILPGGALYGWGYDNAGQVGDGVQVDKLSPVSTGLHFVSAVTGGVFSLGLDTEGNVWGWGSSVNGDLGVGSASGTFLTPQLVEGGVSAISATAWNAENLHR